MMLRSALAALAGLGFLAIASALPAYAQGPARDTPTQAAPSADAAAAHETFRARVLAEVEDWRVKMHGFDETMEARGKHQANAAEARLRTAWDDTEAQARYVQAATAPDWDRAKQAYRAASHRMALAWAKLQT